MSSLYEDPIQSIVSCVKSLQRRLDSTMNYIFIVGGFSRSFILRERMTAEFETATTKIVFPNHPGMAVAQGAVHFGLNPSIISSRCSAFTYGFETLSKFVEGVHDPIRKITRGGIFYCNNIFSTFVKVNERVQLNHEASTFVGIVQQGQTHCTIPLYTSLNEDNMYITTSMTKVGKLCVAIPPDEEVGKHNVKVSMIFGGTEIAAKAEHIISHHKVDCKIDFFTKMDFSSISPVHNDPIPAQALIQPAKTKFSIN